MTTPTVYNKAKLKEAMEKLDAFDSDKVTEPKDAYIDETSSGFEIVEEVEGNQLDEDKVYELLCQAVTDGKTEVNLEESDCYLKPKKTSDNKKLKKKLASLQKYWDMTVTYEIGDASDVLDYQTFKDWMTVDSSGNVSFDWNHIADWIGQLADKYDTFGTDETFHTSLGETVTVTSMNYGWKMDEETEAAWLDETLKSGESATRQPQWLESAMARGEENDIGDTYVEIDITNQRMWFYKDGQCLVDTPVVTGDATKDGYETPLGLYCLFDKEAKAILRGADNLTARATIHRLITGCRSTAVSVSTMQNGVQALAERFIREMVRMDVSIHRGIRQVLFLTISRSEHRSLFISLRSIRAPALWQSHSRLRPV